MSVRRLLCLSSVALGVVQVSPLATAGEKIQFSIAGINSDKIEFSAPTAAIDTPTAVKEDKDLPRLEYHPAPVSDRLFLEDNFHASPPAQMVVLTPGRRGDDLDSRDASKRDPDYGYTKPRNSFDSLLAPRNPGLESFTNHFNDQKDWNTDAARASMYGNKIDAASREDSFQSRLNPVNTPDRNGIAGRRENGDAWRTRNTPEESSWTFTYFHHDPGFARNHDGEFMPSYTELMAAGQHSASASTPAPSAPVADEAYHNSSRTTGPVDYQPTARYDAPAATSGLYQTYQTTRPGTLYQNSGTYARQETSGLYSSQAQPPPAILPFPKRPGDVLK
jgi:hypothetical protein